MNISKQVPYTINADLSKTRDGEKLTDTKAYQSNIGTLRFIADTTHPDIGWIVEVLGRHLHKPAQPHTDAIKPILRYLASQAKDDPIYRPNVELNFTCYTDTDYAADPDTRRSITDLICSIGDQPFTWISARQATVTHSSIESEYSGVDTGAKAITWACSLSHELRIPRVRRVPSLRIDDKPATKYRQGHIVIDNRTELHNKGAFDITHTNGPSDRTKHLDVRHHCIQQQVHNKVLRLTQLANTEQRADFLTKSVVRVLFKQAMKSLGHPA